MSLRNLLLYGGLAVFGVGLCAASFGITQAGSGLAFLGALGTLFSLKEKGRRTESRAALQTGAFKPADKR